MKVLVKEVEMDLNDLENLYAKSRLPKVLFEVSKKDNNFIYFGLEAKFYVVCNNNKVFLVNNNLQYKEIKEKSFDFIRKIINENKCEDERFPFIGGFLGYISYDMVQEFEEKLHFKNMDEICADDMIMGFYENLYIYDKKLEKTFNLNLEISEYQFEDFTGKYEKKIENNEKNHNLNLDISNLKEQRQLFCEKVSKAKEYIKAGDIFQVVLSNRIVKKTEKDNFNIYKDLKVINKSKYMYCLDYSRFSIIGTSPEILVSLSNKKCVTNPIAGTIKRDKDVEIEAIRINTLLNDKKELAEHNMLVDLGRNDIGRVCEFGSVQVSEYLNVEKFSHVIHLSSTVNGILKENNDGIDLLQSVMPVGTVSGAPKFRAMEIIEELEDSKRGIYSGAVGYFSLNGNLDFAITIRSIVKMDNKAYLQAGAGIVYDSDEEKEYEETINKMKVLMEVL
ncbi:MAG: anthranilate synthase component I family protein [Sarcina sp.]